MESENNTTLDLNKPSKFKGLHFKRWRQKMLFFLTTKKIEPTIAQTKASQTWIENDFLAKNYILNGFSDDLYDYYSDYGTAKDLWEALQKKYDTEEAGAKKFAVRRYLKYQMVDDKSNSLRHKTKKFSLECLITRLRIEEEATNFNRNLTPVVLKPNGKNMKILNKNHNKHLNNNTNKVQNQNLSHPHNRYQPPSCAAYDLRQFECYNCHKLGHLA
ncbi:hypothetical protein D8674_028801 [Pyrus ussuriensis x Pyrus communis]|uniref:CCHC-type domain-containing protein n=1 Tax=Pyrus ussuriensis x Pyrus communis TaxID=2448454 RepID=A0A5N5IAT0_9ROSA|nr:hypothetical protein D8674_028801 [Pyrus ussuriensis x Pyrus communis]